MGLTADKAGSTFTTAALNVLEMLARTRETFTADDFWQAMLETHPQYPLAEYGDASGAAFQKAYRRGIMRRTGARVKSARPDAHSKDQAVLTGKPGHKCLTCGGTGLV